MHYIWLGIMYCCKVQHALRTARNNVPQKCHYHYLLCNKIILLYDIHITFTHINTLHIHTYMNMWCPHTHMNTLHIHTHMKTFSQNIWTQYLYTWKHCQNMWTVSQMWTHYVHTHTHIWTHYFHRHSNTYSCPFGFLVPSECHFKENTWQRLHTAGV